MAERSSADVKIYITDGNGRLTDSPAGVHALLTGVLTLNGISAQQLTEEGYAYGDAFVFFDAVGISRVGDIQMTMFFDDTATTGNYAIFANGSRYRTFKVTYGGTTPNILQQQLDVVISAVNINATKGEKIKLEVTLQPNSAMVTSYV